MKAKLGGSCGELAAGVVLGPTGIGFLHPGDPTFAFLAWAGCTAWILALQGPIVAYGGASWGSDWFEHYLSDQEGAELETRHREHCATAHPQVTWDDFLAGLAQ